MPTSYTSLVGLALPATGELSGTWGNTVNNYITQYTDAAIAGSQVISGAQTAVDLSVSNGVALVQAGSAGIVGSAQYQIIRCTGNPAGTLTITAPAASKAYVVINATSTSQSVVLRGAGPTTGVTIAAGSRALVAWNGSDYAVVSASNQLATAGGAATVDASGNLVMSAGAIREKQSAVAASDINLNTGNYFSKTISGTTTFTVSNTASSGNASSFILDLTNGGSAVITWWANVKWAGGTAPTLTVSGRDVLGFFTYNGGTTWTGLVLGKDVK